METTRSFVIDAPPGFAPQIGRLVAMMTYARGTTLRAVEGLATTQLDHLHDSESNSIGALLAHVTAVETAYQHMTFGAAADVLADQQYYMAALQLGDAARTLLRGRPLEHYLEQLRAVRDHTLRELAARADPWLDEATPLFNGQPANNYWKWFHVFEDELNHRGQIRWLRQRLPAGTA